MSATYLKFNTEEREKREEGDKAKSKASLPPTLSHLVTLWDEISMKVIENSSKPFAPPEVPALAQDLLKRYEEEKKQVEKLKKDEKKSGSSGGVGGGGGSTNCELCDEIFPDPVTYHMKEAHAGCGRHASGWGYNSRGSYCSGWAGNCGDGGRGGSTWYLLCKDCHAKFMSVKAEKRKKITKPVFTPRVKTRKPGKPRSLPVVSAVQGMIKNSKFLLEVAWGAGDNSKRSTTPQHDSSLRQSSIPEGEEFIEKRLSLPRPSADTLLPLRQPYLLRSASLATSHPAPLSRTYSDSGEEAMNLTPQFSRQTTLATPEEASKASLGSSLMSKPSMALANLMYLRSKQGAEDKETGYGRAVMLGSGRPLGVVTCSQATSRRNLEFLIIPCTAETTGRERGFPGLRVLTRGVKTGLVIFLRFSAFTDMNFAWQSLQRRYHVLPPRPPSPQFPAHPEQ